MKNTAARTRFFVSLRMTALLAAPSVLGAQQASFIYKLGKDTVIAEQFTRTATRLSGDVVTRMGAAAVTRTQYDATIGGDGRITALTYKILGTDGKPIKGRALEVRYVAAGDSIKREVIFPDSTQSRTLGAAGAIPFATSSIP